MDGSEARGEQQSDGSSVHCWYMFTSLTVRLIHYRSLYAFFPASIMRIPFFLLTVAAVFGASPEERVPGLEIPIDYVGPTVHNWVPPQTRPSAPALRGNIVEVVADAIRACCVAICDRVPSCCSDSDEILCDVECQGPGGECPCDCKCGNCCCVCRVGESACCCNPLCCCVTRPASSCCLLCCCP